MGFYSIGNIMGGGGFIVPSTDTAIISAARAQTAQAAAVQAPTLIAPSQMSPMPSTTTAPVLTPGVAPAPMQIPPQVMPMPGTAPSSVDPSVTVAAPAPPAAPAPLEPYPAIPPDPRGFWARQSPFRKGVFIAGGVGVALLALRLVR